jgi:hypothetical protein
MFSSLWDDRSNMIVEIHLSSSLERLVLDLQPLRAVVLESRVPEAFPQEALIIPWARFCL